MDLLKDKAVSGFDIKTEMLSSKKYLFSKVPDEIKSVTVKWEK